jgi:hypothetical protein
MVVASLKPVPQDVKKGLESLGVEVVDRVYLRGAGEKRLIEYVKQALSSNRGLVYACNIVATSGP